MRSREDITKAAAQLEIVANAALLCGDDLSFLTVAPVLSALLWILEEPNGEFFATYLETVRKNKAARNN